MTIVDAVPQPRLREQFALYAKFLDAAPRFV
jgi:hypothetical protein